MSIGILKEELNDTYKALVDKYNRCAFLVPLYKNVVTPSVMSFYVFMSRLYQLGFSPAFYFLDQTNISVARNQLVAQYLDAVKKNKDYDIVTWIDSDHIFDIIDWLKLLYHYDSHDEIEVLSAKYITRDNNYPRVCAYKEYEDKFKAISDGQTGIKVVDGVGFGFCMMTTSVLQKMTDEYGLHQFLFAPKGPKEFGGVIGEDLDWCIKARKLGYKIYVDLDVEIKHYGGVIDQDYLDMKRKVARDGISKTS